jgi:hypothetical protein
MKKTNINSKPILDQSRVIVDDEYYPRNSRAQILAICQAGLDRPQIDFPIWLDIPRLNWGISRSLSIPLLGDEYLGVSICVNMWIWPPESSTSILAVEDIRKLWADGLLVCPIQEIRLWRNKELIYSCDKFRIPENDGFGGQGVVLGSGKLVSIIFTPVCPLPIINWLSDERYNDYVLDVEFVSQPDFEKKGKTKITLRTARVQLLSRVYSNDIRRYRFNSKPINNGI